MRCRKSNAVHDNAVKGARDKNGDEKCTQLRKMLFSLSETKGNEKLQCHGNFPKVISDLEVTPNFSKRLCNFI